jgi:hypothetical protein
MMVKQREEFTELGEQITWKEFLKAVSNLQNDKAPGMICIPPNAFKCLDGKHKQTVFQYINNFGDKKADYWEWHQGLEILLPKKGNLSDPNKWRGINLMDLCSKIFSCILNNHLYRLLQRHGTKTQFGATPKVGC